MREKVKQEVKEIVEEVLRETERNKIIGMFYYDGRWIRFLLDDIVDRFEDNIKIKMWHEFIRLGKIPVWVKVNNVIFYKPDYSRLQRAIELRAKLEV